MAVQPDGRVVVAEYQTLFRLTATGALDSTFGTNGEVITSQPDYANAVNVLADGRLLVAGIEKPADSAWRYFVARYTVDGVADPTFGTGGVGVETEALDGGGRVGLVVQTNGKAVIAGYNRSSSGSLDFAAARFLGDDVLSAALVQQASALAMPITSHLFAETPHSAADGIASLGERTLGVGDYSAIWTEDAAGHRWDVTPTTAAAANWSIPSNERSLGQVDHTAGSVLADRLFAEQRLRFDGLYRSAPLQFAAPSGSDELFGLADL